MPFKVGNKWRTAAKRKARKALANVHRNTSRKIAKVETVLLHSGAELLAACKSGDAAAAMRLLGTEGIDVNAKDKKDYTPLHWACVKGLKRVALALVQGVINVNAMNVYNMTALHYVCLYGHTEVALALIDHKVNKAPRSSGNTPLCIAAVYGRTAVVSKLLLHGADKSIRGDPSGIRAGTPLEAVEFILANKYGRRGTHHARWHKNHAAIVALLA
jgi:ankyrin repeat protein